MTSGLRIARIYFSLRTAHLERFRQLDPSTLIYRKARYDFDPSVAGQESPPVKMGRVATLWHLLTHTYDVVEVNEPAIAWLWGDLLLQAGAIRLRAALTRTRTCIVTYCIALVEPADDAVGHRFHPRQAVMPVTGVVMKTLVRSMDRVAFGTTESYNMYARHVGRRTLVDRSRMFEAVPAPCECLREAENQRDGRSVVFVGAFTERKGIRQLMCAWDEVALQRPDIRLTIIGKGDRETEVASWADSRPGVVLIVDPPRDLIHRSLRKASCGVLLSQRVGGWREQVGLPIVEALSHGCEVVTTDETGLAPWLSAHGHAVVAADSAPEVVAAEIIARIDRRRPAETVLRDLPAQDQRLTADQWMVWGAKATKCEIDARPPRHASQLKGGEDGRQTPAVSSSEH